MTFSTDVVVYLERARVAGAPPEWNDVLARAGHRAPRPRRRMLAFAAAGASAAVVLAASAIGATLVGALPWRSDAPGELTAAADLVDASGRRLATVTVRLPGRSLTVKTGSRRVKRPFVVRSTWRWHVHFATDPSGYTVSVRTRAAGRMPSKATKLCGPCRRDESGVVRSPTFPLVVQTLTGRLTATLMGPTTATAQLRLKRRG